MNKKALFILGFLVILGIVRGMGSYQTPKEEVKIGALIPLTGRFANLGEDVRNGLELARKDLEKDGVSLKLIYEDSAADPKVSVPGANKLVNFDNADVIIGGTGSSANLAILPILNENQTILIAISSTPKLNTAGRHVIKVQHDIDIEAAYVAEHLYKTGVKSAAVLYDGTSDTLTVGKEVFARKFTELGGEVVLADQYDAKVLEFKAAMTKVKAANPEAIYLLAIEKVAGSAVKQARELGLTQPIYGFSVLESSEFLDAGKQSTEGVTFTTVPFSCQGNQTSQDYCKKYSEAYGKEPLQYSAHAYDVLQIIGDSIKRKGMLDKEAVITSFEGTEYDGVAGTLKFDRDGNIQMEKFVLKTVKDGKFINFGE